MTILNLKRVTAGLFLGVVAVAAGGGVGVPRSALAQVEQATKPGSTEIPTVAVARPVAREIREHAEFVGRTEARTRVVKARVGGLVEKVHVREGQAVKKGDLLFEIDPRTYQNRVTEHEARVAQAKAKVDAANVSIRRANALMARNAIGREEFDLLAANVVEVAAGLAVAQAELDRVALDLEFTKILALADGVIGGRTAEVGAAVKPLKTTLATIIEVDPILVAFDIDQLTFLKIHRDFRERKVSDEISVSAALNDETGFPHRSKIKMSQGRPDPATGTFRFQAEFSNADQVLFSGLFVRVQLAIGPPQAALLVPEVAIRTDSWNKPVLHVLIARNVVETRSVELGGEYDGLRWVRKGLKADDRVIVDRAATVQPGATVQPRVVQP